MRVVRLHADGLRLEEAERPVPREGEVLVEVHAAAITRDELEWPADRLPAVPSHELSGVVADTGEDVFALTPFDRDGVAAHYAVVPTAVLATKPHNLTHVEAAALPMGGLSAWQGLFVHGRLQPGERVIVTGSSGGVGHLAVQLALHAGAVVVEDPPADLVFDTVGGELPAGGRTVTIAAESPGATYFIVEPDRSQLVEIARLAETGELVPEIDSTFALENAQDAFDRVAAHGKRGKVVLEVAEEALAERSSSMGRARRVRGKDAGSPDIREYRGD
jgi:NADPH:quinone reductase-like Zn-dependent oxidoreductase